MQQAEAGLTAPCKLCVKLLPVSARKVPWCTSAPAPAACLHHFCLFRKHGGGKTIGKKNKSFSFKPRPLHRGAGTGYRAWGHPALKICCSLREIQNTANSLQQECTFCALTQREGSMGPLGILWYPIPGVPHPLGYHIPSHQNGTGSRCRDGGRKLFIGLRKS